MKSFAGPPPSTVHSEHPIAIAINEAARAKGVTIPPIENYVSITGRGATAT
jgi:cation transport ATPase